MQCAAVKVTVSTLGSWTESMDGEEDFRLVADRAAHDLHTRQSSIVQGPTEPAMVDGSTMADDCSRLVAGSKR